MKYVDEFHAPALTLSAIEALRAAVEPGRQYRFMEFCGGHTHALFQSGLIDLLPAEITMVHGPGCPVCVLPPGPITAMIRLLQSDPTVIVTTYADLMRVPAQGGSFSQARDRGLDVRSVYAPTDAYALARRHPNRKIVFMAIGFETTAPPTALILQRARREGITNFFVYCNHLCTAPALRHILNLDAEGHLHIDGFIGPGHVALVTGSKLFERFANRWRKPIVISGFTPLDLAQAIGMLVRQVNRGRHAVEIGYSRAVTATGNTLAQQALTDCFEPREASTWRGLGQLPESSLRIRDTYASWDAEACFQLEPGENRDHPKCLCPEILLGAKAPLECRLFAKACTPANPLGPCMVSSEGACSAVFLAGRHLLTQTRS